MIKATAGRLIVTDFAVFLLPIIKGSTIFYRKLKQPSNLT
jgi:hypothetical protein